MATDKRALTEKQLKWAHLFMKYGNAAKAVRESGYDCANKRMEYKLASINLNNPRLKANIEEQKKIREMDDAAHKARVETIREEATSRINEKVKRVLDIYDELLQNPKLPDRLKFDVAKDLLDRAGFKATEKRELTGRDGGPIQSEHNVINEIAERARKLLVIQGGA